jgi:hypothetical protein
MMSHNSAIPRRRAPAIGRAQPFGGKTRSRGRLRSGESVEKRDSYGIGSHGSFSGLQETAFPRRGRVWPHYPKSHVAEYLKYPG